MAEELKRARELLAAGDVPGLLRHLRAQGDAIPLDEVARLVAKASRRAGFADLEQAASAAAKQGKGSGDKSVRALYGFGYACIERGIEYLAIRPLARALELAPSAVPVLSELAVALEREGQHARAVAVLEGHESVLQWPHRFQYVYNALMAGDLGKAAEGFSRLPEPEDAALVPPREKVRRMLARGDVARSLSSLDAKDLRGWHYVLTGGMLATLSPHGFDQGMTGRYAYLGDSPESCAAALQRLGLILEAAGAVPESVTLLPDRSSRILGLAAAEVLGLPTTDFDASQLAPRSLVVAYNLNEADPGTVAALRERVPGQVLFERATCWTDPPCVAADVTGLLCQDVVPAWEGQLRRLDDGTVGPGPADERLAEAVAAGIAGTGPEHDEGDGGAPPDPDEGLRSFVGAVASPGARERDGGWLGGAREYIATAGPVPSSRFA